MPFWKAANRCWRKLSDVGVFQSCSVSLKSEARVVFLPLRSSATRKAAGTMATLTTNLRMRPLALAPVLVGG